MFSSTRHQVRPGFVRDTSRVTARWFWGTSSNGTDGVFTGLTDGRLPTPWIDAWRLQNQGHGSTDEEAQPDERDLSPKKMSDSYHRVVSDGWCRLARDSHLGCCLVEQVNLMREQVLPLGRDPWLSDTYLNSSGHIRSATLIMKNISWHV